MPQVTEKYLRHEELGQSSTRLRRVVFPQKLFPLYPTERNDYLLIHMGLSL